MASVIYNKGKAELWRAGIDLVNDTIKLALVTSTYVPNIDTHHFFSDITNEVVGTGYTAGGKAVTTPTVTEDDTNDKAVFDCDAVVWASSVITARGGVMYKDTGVAATSALLYYFDFVTDQISSGPGTFTATPDAAGISEY